jgi:hypothetical protein
MSAADRPRIFQQLAWIWLGLLVLVMSCGGAETARRPVPLEDLPAATREARLTNDLAATKVYRDGLANVLSFMRSRPDLFPVAALSEPRVLVRADREAVWGAWKSFLDYLLALDALGQYHQAFFRLSGQAAERSFLVAYGGFLAQYRHALAFIALAENDPSMDALLNEAVSELGLPKETYAKLKFRFLHLGRGTEFVALEAMYLTKGGDNEPDIRAGIAADREIIWRMGRGKGPLLTAQNALAVVQRAGAAAWFPVQAGVSEWMGDTKVLRQGTSLISEAQLTELTSLLQPGDILLVRHEWYLSNIGLPGFWPHAVLVIGSEAERRAYFATPEVQTWVRTQGQADGDFEVLLKAREPDAYAASAKPLHGEVTRTIEAISDGVSFNSLEAAGEADSLVVLRPRLTKAEKAQAILRAYHYTGRPYDFDFDFRTDSALVCTELVYKAYEPAKDYRGLTWPTVTMLGRPVLPANEIARLFDQHYETKEQQLDFITFLDGQEKLGKALPATLAEFRLSWQRPKWHILVQPEPVQ